MEPLPSAICVRGWFTYYIYKVWLPTLGYPVIEPIEFAHALVELRVKVAKLLIGWIGGVVVDHLSDQSVCPRRLHSESLAVFPPCKPYDATFERI